MSKKENVLEAIYAAVDELNGQLAIEDQLVKSPESKLFGTAGGLDSLNIINLIIATEQQIEIKFNEEIDLSSDFDVSEGSNFLGSIEDLSDYIVTLLETK